MNPGHKVTGRDRQHVLLVEYRCRRGCLLLHVFTTPDGPHYYRPAVRISDRLAARTGTPYAGRNPETGGALTELAATQTAWGDAQNTLLLGCSHVAGLRFPAAQVHADAAAATPGAPVVRRDFWMRPDEPA